MAIFMATTKSISRGSGQSAVASASYRAGEKLQDERYGKTQDYSKRHGVMSADIILPTRLTGLVEIDRNTLWNLAERAEKRKDARVGREWIVNLPHELDESVRKQLAHEFAQSLADKYGVIADCCIHRPTQKEIERGADPRNFHAHIMLTTRQAVLSASGQLLLGEKATIELSDTKRRSLGLERVSTEIVELRELWERTANAKLAEYGHELIDSRSYQSQGIDIVPQLKMGKNATQMERDGLQTPVGDINRLIKERNELVFSQELATIEHTNQMAYQIIFDSRKPKMVTQDNTLPSNQSEAPITQTVSLAINTTRPNEADKPVETKKVGTVDEVVQTASPRIEERAKQSFQSKYEQWKQQKNAPVAKAEPSPLVVTTANIDPPSSVPTPMSFNERRQAWQAEQARKKQEAEEQRLAEQARLAEIAEQQRQAHITQEQARQQALAQKQAEHAEEKRLAQLEQERQIQVREAEQQKLAQQDQARQQEIDCQRELERNRRRFSP